MPRSRPRPEGLLVRLAELSCCHDDLQTLEQPAEKVATDTECDQPGLKPALILDALRGAKAPLVHDAALFWVFPQPVEAITTKVHEGNLNGVLRDPSSLMPSLSVFLL
jgi:hypothetical protein